MLIYLLSLNISEQSDLKNATNIFGFIESQGSGNNKKRQYYLRPYITSKQKKRFFFFYIIFILIKK